MTCPVCDDYEFVPGPDGLLERCEACVHEELVCPVHGQHARSRNGVVTRQCVECHRAVKAAVAWLREHPYAVPVPVLA